MQQASEAEIDSEARAAIVIGVIVAIATVAIAVTAVVVRAIAVVAAVVRPIVAVRVTTIAAPATAVATTPAAAVVRHLSGGFGSREVGAGGSWESGGARRGHVEQAG